MTSSSPRLVGTVRWYKPGLGYGFIAPEDGGADVFVHISALRASGLDALRDGQRIEFTIGRGRDGRTRAEALVVVNGQSGGAGCRLA